MNEFYNRFVVAREINKVREADKKIFSKSQEQMEKEIESLKRQLQVAAIFAATQPHCPDGKDCDGYSTSEQSCTACWLECWRQK